jgi:hypothetical protein
MPRISLTQGAYEARSIIANAQRCLNLYPEKNPKDSPAPMTHYPTPGLALDASAPVTGAVRCIYTATNGALYAVVAQNVYYISTLPSWSFTLLGTLGTTVGAVDMNDNGLAILLVDGTAGGWAINLADNSFDVVPATNFYGGNRVGEVDTYFVLNRPGTNQFYISLSQVTYAMLIGGTAFDALDIAAKVGYSDQMVATLVVNRQIWLFGEVTTEVWYNSGAPDFTFQRIDGVFIEHGCAAPASVAKHDSSLYWLSQDKQGSFMVMRNAGYQAIRVSTHAIENEISSYTVISDAIGYTYLQEGHVFYVLTFPTANRTWVYDIATELWHERGWFNDNGNQFRHRSNCHTYYQDRNLVGDFQNGAIYHFDLNSGLDNGEPIPRIRSFPHLMNDGKRVRYLNFIADMQVGELQDAGSDDQPIVSLRWSDTRGASWGNYIQQSLGAPGDYLKSLQFRRLGMARDRVFELSWSTPIKTALNGAFIEMSASAT